MLPLELRLGAALAAAVAIWIGVHTWERGLIQQGEQKQAQIQEIANGEARNEQARLAGRAQQRQQEIVDAYRKQAQQESAAAADARRDLERLRLAAAAADGGAADAGAGAVGGTADARILRGLLVEGVDLAEEGRGRVAALVGKVTALQDNARLCAAP